MRFSGSEPPESVARYQVRARGRYSAESLAGWLRDRRAWREQHPGELLPVMDSLTWAAVCRLVERGELATELYAAERVAPSRPPQWQADQRARGITDPRQVLT